MSKYRVMIVDDDDDTRKMLALALQPRYEVVEAGDGLDALSKLETHEPDFAIIDIMMPMMDGYQLCEAIRRHPRFNVMQVMFLSAYGSKENVQRSYAAGANLFMTKPVNPSRILKNIDFTIEHEPPPLRRKRYTLKELEALDILQEENEKARVRVKAESQSREQPAPPPRPTPSPTHRSAPQTGYTAQPQPQPAPQSTPQSAPQPAPQPAAQAQARPADVNHGPVHPRVLVVDDDLELLRMMDLALRDYFEVARAANGIEAIERMVDCEPDLMLLDIMMPKMNGYQLLQS
ncbi:MAG: response regulator, partial [bacterium]|nr:response regulator [bacterium]